MLCISKEEVNTGRQIEMDIAKAVCIIGMVIVHSFETINDLRGGADTGLAFVFVNVLDCIFGAGTFMFCMGMGIAYSNRTSPEYLMKRGVKLFVLAYVLNIIRALAAFFLYGFEVYIAYAFTLDIMQFAGLALFTFGLLKKLKVKDLVVEIIAIVMSLIGSYFGTIQCNSFAQADSVGLFFGSFDPNSMTGSTFPLFNWFIFVSTGYIFAKLLRRCSDKKKLYITCSSLAGIVVLIYMFLAIPKHLGMMGDITVYYDINTFNAFICICGALLALGLYHAWSYVLPNCLNKLFTNMSKNINRIYFAQWIIIGWTGLTINYFCTLPDWLVIVYGIIVIIISVLIANFIERRKN